MTLNQVAGSVKVIADNMKNICLLFSLLVQSSTYFTRRVLMVKGCAETLNNVYSLYKRLWDWMKSFLLAGKLFSYRSRSKLNTLKCFSSYWPLFKQSPLKWSHSQCWLVIVLNRSYIIYLFLQHALILEKWCLLLWLHGNR